LRARCRVMTCSAALPSPRRARSPLRPDPSGCGRGWCRWVSDEEAPDRLVWVGEDDRGLELEVVALVLPDYLLVIHVMPTQLRRRRR